MDMKFSGKAWKLPDDVDTDTILPGIYATLHTPEELGKHCLEPLRPELASLAQLGDILVAGKNFGCGSSREHAPVSIMGLGIKCIIAKSFARIFYRNGINNGMFLIESKDMPDNCEEGDIVTVEINKMITVNGKEFTIPKIPENLFEIIQDGGLIESYRKKNEAEGGRE